MKTRLHPCGPLAAPVLAAFTEQHSHHDRDTIACYLAGATFLYTTGGKHSKKGIDAYTLVAEDVLGQLHAAGYLSFDGGWYTLAHKQPIDLNESPTEAQLAALLAQYDDSSHEHVLWV